MMLTDEQLDDLEEKTLSGAAELEKPETGALLLGFPVALDLLQMAKACNKYERHGNVDLPWDCNDKAIYDFKFPSFVRSFLAINSLNATCTSAIRDAGHMPTLYGSFQGRPVRVTMVSRLGDVGIAFTDRERGYDERCSIFDLSNFSPQPPEGFK